MNSIQVYRLRLVREAQLDYDPITHPLAAERTVRLIATQLLDGLDREAGLVLALDARNRPIGCHVVSIGTLSASLIHPREVFKFAILANAASLRASVTGRRSAPARKTRNKRSIRSG